MISTVQNLFLHLKLLLVFSNAALNVCHHIKYQDNPNLAAPLGHHLKDNIGQASTKLNTLLDTAYSTLYWLKSYCFS